MLTHDSRTSRGRRVLRAAVPLSTTLTLVLTGGLVASASADTPRSWEQAPHVSGLDFLLVLLLIPLGLAAIVSFLAFLPTLAGDHGYQPGQSWRDESEWFGGPTKGLDAAHEVSHQELAASSSDTGGTSGRW